MEIGNNNFFTTSFKPQALIWNYVFYKRPNLVRVLETSFTCLGMETFNNIFERVSHIHSSALLSLLKECVFVLVPIILHFVYVLLLPFTNIESQTGQLHIP